MSSGGQSSGAITLDLSSVAASIVMALEPIIGQININLERLAGLLAASVVDEDRAVDVLARHLPSVHLESGVLDVQAIGGHLAEHLAQAGYALVAVAGPALEAEVRRHGFRGVSSGVAPVVDPATAQAVREDQWFAEGRSD